MLHSLLYNHRITLRPLSHLWLHTGALQDGLEHGGQQVNRVRVLQATALGLHGFKRRGMAG